ncbi:MAG: hypothetical protein EOO65_05015 [Methanosarcinales archaeon]|nr:MAG: hypothetical protein EOO65_05015 [Methanosarcinales archaeon]
MIWYVQQRAVSARLRTAGSRRRCCCCCCCCCSLRFQRGLFAFTAAESEGGGGVHTNSSTHAGVWMLALYATVRARGVAPSMWCDGAGGRRGAPLYLASILCRQFILAPARATMLEICQPPLSALALGSRLPNAGVRLPGVPCVCSP